MEIAGYQSDIKITTNIFNEDKYTAEKGIAEFGVTTGTKANTYELSLAPQLSKPYQKGLRIQVQFHEVNTSTITLNVDGKGAVPVVKLMPICSGDNGVSKVSIPTSEHHLSRTVNTSKTESENRLKKGIRNGFSLQGLASGDIAKSVHYILLYDGKQFQIINHIPECPIESKPIVLPPSENKLFFNRQELLTIQKDHVDPRISVNIGRNRYAAINGNLIVARDIRIKRTGGPGALFGARIKFPKPLDPSAARTPGALQSLEGNTYFYSMDKNGVIQIQGELLGVNDEINVNFYPYIAKYPLEYDTEIDFSQIQAPKDKLVEKTVPRKTTGTKTSTKPKTK